MEGFRLVCGRCSSENVIERSSTGRLDWPVGYAIYSDGIQRKCMDCGNESFVILKTRREVSSGS